MKKIYYAHSMHLYNTPQEKRDVELLEKLGFKVINPNSEETQKGVEEYKKIYGAENTMKYFNDILLECDALVFRAHIDGKIPAGIGYEINVILSVGRPVIELPTLLESDFMSINETRQYLALNGQR